MGRLAGQLRLRVVVREGDVELGRAADLEPDEVRLEARDQPLLAEDQRHPLGRAALERLAVAGAHEGDDRVVAVLGAAALDGRQRRVLVAQLLDDLVDLGVVDRLDLGPEVEVLVVAELDLGADLDGRLEDERLALLGLDDLDVGVGQRQDLLLDEGLAVGVLDEVLDGLVEDRARPEVPLEDGARRLARPEAGDARPARQPADGVVRWRGRGARRAARSRARWSTLGPGVVVICIAGKYTGEAGTRVRTAPSAADLVGERGIEPPRRSRGTGS